MKFSGRAHNVVFNVLLKKSTLPTGELLTRMYGHDLDVFLNEYIEKSEATPLRNAVLAALGVGRSSAYSQLLLEKNCGQVATREICVSLGLWMPDKPHTCRCRICGRAMS